MGLNFSQRQPEGFYWEDRIANRLRRRGHEVTVMSRNSRFDLMVDSNRVDVKAAALTTYAGSDGYPITAWVFSNLSNPPTCDFYVLVCLSRDRNTVEKYYIVPSSHSMQKTISITSRDKWRSYMDRWDYFDSMKKHAEEQDINEDIDRHVIRDMISSVVGAATGVAIYRGTTKGSLYVENQSISFGDVISAYVGAATGRAIDRASRRNSRLRELRRNRPTRQDPLERDR